MPENASPVAPVQNIVHTPGPWGVEQTSVSNWIGRMRADGSKVEYIVAHTDRDSLRDDVLVRNDANARLIAAAPDLLAHLRHMIWLVEIELKEDGGHILAGAKAAVAKAQSVDTKDSIGMINDNRNIQSQLRGGPASLRAYRSSGGLDE